MVFTETSMSLSLFTLIHIWNKMGQCFLLCISLIENILHYNCYYAVLNSKRTNSINYVPITFLTETEN